MRKTPVLLTALTVVLAAWLAAGCAKKAAEAPPAPPPTPPVTQPTTPTPAPTTPAPPETPTPAAPQVTAADLEDVFFDLDSYALRDDGRAVLDRLAKRLRDAPVAALTIEGHCDERGTIEYNQALGEKRANAARDYLVSAGIPGSRLQTISYGKERPFAEGHDESAWAQNRRAHFVLR